MFTIQDATRSVRLPRSRGRRLRRRHQSVLAAVSAAAGQCAHCPRLHTHVHNDRRPAGQCAGDLHVHALPIAANARQHAGHESGD